MASRLLLRQRVIPRERALLYLGLYLWSFGITLLLYMFKNSLDPSLNGEELAVSFRNVVYFESHLQPDCYASNFSGTFLFWIFSHIPPISIETPRILKIATQSFISPLLAAVLYRVLPSPRTIVALLPGIIFPLLPSLSWYGIMSVEIYCDSVFALALLVIILDFDWEERYLAMVVRLFALILLSVWTIHFYPGSAPILAVSFLIVFVRSILPWKGLKKTVFRNCIFTVTVFLSYLLYLWPHWYYRGEIITGTAGGSLQVTLETLKSNIALLYRDLFIQAYSYFLGGLRYPAIPLWRTGAILVGLAALGSSAIFRHRRLGWILIIGALSISVALISGENTGVRRCIPFIFSLLIFASCGVDYLIRSRTLFTRFFLIPLFLVVLLYCVYSSGESFYEYQWLALIGAGVLLITVVFISTTRAYLIESSIAVWIVIQLITLSQTYQALDGTFKVWLMRNFTYIEGTDYATTVERLLARIQDQPIVLDNSEYSPDTGVLLHLICERRHLPCKQSFIKGPQQADPRLENFLFSQSP